MRQIEIEPGLTVQFHGRNEDFAQGVEIGALVAVMATGIPQFCRSISVSAVNQAQVVAQGMGYRILADHNGDVAHLIVSSTAVRPKLRLVSQG